MSELSGPALVHKLHRPYGSPWAPFCAHCHDHRGDHVPWPCPTVHALATVRRPVGHRVYHLSACAGKLEQYKTVVTREEGGELVALQPAFVEWLLNGVEISDERARAIIAFERSIGNTA